jgi:hypothetical protein
MKAREIDQWMDIPIDIERAIVKNSPPTTIARFILSNFETCPL